MLLRAFAALLFLSLSVSAATPLEEELRQLTAHFPGRVGVCVDDSSQPVCLNGDQRFSMQSVMKLVVSLTVLERIDKKIWKLDDPVIVRRQDLSVFVQPIAKEVKSAAGYRTTIADLMRRAIINSDSAAVDILLDKLGGPAPVNEFLKRHGIEGMRLDRDERHLQTDIVGLTWKPEYVDAKLLDRAIDAVPKAQHDAAWERYRADVRDTSTPRAMTTLLRQLALNRLLSPASNSFALAAMAECATFPDRLKAGVTPPWTIAHKTGTSGTWNGLTIATNDVGILRVPDQNPIALAVFVADSHASPAETAALMARIAATVIKAHPVHIH